MLIAESGATKTEWRLIRNGKQTLAFRTPGFNPNVMSETAIEGELRNIIRKHLKEESVSSLYFYGAGLKVKSLQEMVRKVFARLLPGTMVFVDHDLTAASRSTGYEEGILAILGTGSNSCYYKDGMVVEQRGGHGYIFGDEGSGADLGKHLVKGLLEGRFPNVVREFIETQEGVNLEELKFAIYRAEKPNVRMARLSKYLDEILHHDSIREMIEQRFDAFLSSTILTYPNYRDLPISFIGSISYFFKEVLQDRCGHSGIQILNIEHDPIEKLVAYHIRRPSSQMAG